MIKAKSRPGSRSGFPNFPLAELHAHLGTSISPSVLWEIAHESGVKLQQKDYHEFKKFVLLSPRRKMALNDYFKKVYHPILDPLSSGVHAAEYATYQTMAGAYRINNITLMELRNNPIKHSNYGAFDMDHVIMAMLRGMERALLAYPRLSAGLIFILAREFPKQDKFDMNSMIIDKAIKYRRRGVVGIDVGGPGDPDFHFKDYTQVFAKAKKAGLKVTAHTGEQRDANDMWEALEYINPDRIGHGIFAAYDKPLMKELVKRSIVLEVCPLSVIVNKAVDNVDELRFIIRTFVENKIKFCINTDWPEAIENNGLRRQFAFLKEENILSQDELEQCNRTAFEATFIPKPGGLDSYL